MKQDKRMVGLRLGSDEYKEVLTASKGLNLSMSAFTSMLLREQMKRYAAGGLAAVTFNNTLETCNEQI